MPDPARRHPAPSSPAATRADRATGLHPRNRHRGRYDFPALIGACPELAAFVAPSAYGELSIDFADAAAVKALNKALLTLHYDVAGWDVPEGYLCPPIPGRADYIHHLADLLARDGGGRGAAVRVLDIGTGANVIYPLLGHREYGWHFVGSDIDDGALANARRIVDANPGFGHAIELRRQAVPERILHGVVRPGERFDLVMCNPPFHASRADAQDGTARKWRNLGISRAGAAGPKSATLNFGGRGAELYCNGGELAFVRRLIEESARLPESSRWFTSLVSKAANLPAIRSALRAARVRRTLTVEMAQGQKKSRFVAWTFAGARESYRTSPAPRGGHAKRATSPTAGRNRATAR